MSIVPPDRKTEAFDNRVQAATIAKNRPDVMHMNNNEEIDFPNHIANFSKGLPHNTDTGEVDPAAYTTYETALQNALSTTSSAPFETVQLGVPDGRKLVNPSAGLSFDLEGPDSHHVTIRKAPRIDALEGAAEMAEVYWMSLLRDINFTDYDEKDEVEDAVNALNNEFSVYPDWPKSTGGNMTVKSVFRGNFMGDNVGPYISQFMVRGNIDKVLGRDEKDGWVKFGTCSIDQRQVVAIKDSDFVTDYDEWLKVQNGTDRSVDPLNPGNNDYFDSEPRFLRNGRDLATYVHFDALYQAYCTACFYLLRTGAEFADGIPFKNSNKQEGFGTFGGPHILSLVTEVATRALKAVWLQKYFVHRRLRPEAFAGLIDAHKAQDQRADYTGKIHSSILNSPLLDKVFERNEKLNKKHNRGNKQGSYLLPLAFPEGSPIHPSYGAGHATVAGACVTILKAWFKEKKPMSGTILEANHEGTKLKEYQGNDKNQISIHGELNKLAANVAIGRNMAGVHYRSDYIESAKLGEQIAIGILEEQKINYSEIPTYQFMKFDGTDTTI
ncbi:MAG: vanadium-dependent haloperoxidase [Nitrososphaeraceae archaeon]